MAQWIEGIVVENIHWTENLFTLKIDDDENESGRLANGNGEAEKSATGV